MLPHTHDAFSPQPRVFRYSLDWRFLLPVTAPQGICLLLQEDAEFDQTVGQVGIHPSQRLSLSRLQEGNKDSFHSYVMPFGLPSGWAGAASEEQVAFYARLRRSMKADSHLLIGFENAWTSRPASRTDYHAARPGRMMEHLKRAGFRQVKMFGAMPNLSIPEYLFDLEPRAIRFALQNRFRRKPSVLRVLRLLGGTVGWKRISSFLPCYFARAVA